MIHLGWDWLIKFHRYRDHLFHCYAALLLRGPLLYATLPLAISCMSEESWRRPAFLQTLLVSLDAEIFTRYQQFLKAAKAGGGDGRNRRRKACGRELLNGVLETLDISTQSARRTGDLTRVQDCSSLAQIVRDRLTEVADGSFVWTKSIPLVPDVEFECVLEPAYQAAESAWDELSGSLEPASSSHRSRSPVSRSLDISSGSERVVVPPAPRPRIDCCSTPVPPSPRPKIEGRPTPTPPASRRSQTPGPAQRSQTLSSAAVSTQPAADIVVVGPAEDIYQAEASSPTEPCVLYPASDLTPVVTWCAEAIRQGCRKVISLDQHRVADRNLGQTIALVRTALASGIAVVVLLYISGSSFDDHGQRAVTLWRTVLDSCTYPLAPLPIIVTSKPLGHLGKYSALRYIRNHLFWDHDSLEFEAWTHIDDRQDIVAEVNADRYQRAVCWHPRDRRSLLKLCQDERLLKSLTAVVDCLISGSVILDYLPWLVG